MLELVLDAGKKYGIKRLLITGNFLAIKDSYFYPMTRRVTDWRAILGEGGPVHADLPHV